jgi:uncharacterized protein YjiS (DUF1127 family)
MTSINMPVCGNCPDERTDRAAPLAAMLATVGSFIWRILAWPVRVSQARATINDLARMSDHELRDIGLSRQDLRDAASLVLDDDPTHFLKVRADERWHSVHDL